MLKSIKSYHFSEVGQWDIPLSNHLRDHSLQNHMDIKFKMNGQMEDMTDY